MSDVKKIEAQSVTRLYVEYERHEVERHPFQFSVCGDDGCARTRDWLSTLVALDGPGCQHTEHAMRGLSVYGRWFPNNGPDAGRWERCALDGLDE